VFDALETNHYFFSGSGRGGGGSWAISKTNSALQKPMKKYRARGAMGEKIEYMPVQVLFADVKNILAGAFAHQKTHAQPKGDKKIHATEHCPQPPSLKKIMVRPLINKMNLFKRTLHFHYDVISYIVDRSTAVCLSWQ